jgi:hypothetical protein
VRSRTAKPASAVSFRIVSFILSGRCGAEVSRKQPSVRGQSRLSRRPTRPSTGKGAADGHLQSSPI